MQQESRIDKVSQLIPTFLSFGTPASPVPRTKRDNFPRMLLPGYWSHHLLALRGSMGESEEADTSKPRHSAQVQVSHRQPHLLRHSNTLLLTSHVRDNQHR